jgi:hypothetical protein
LTAGSLQHARCEEGVWRCGDIRTGVVQLRREVQDLLREGEQLVVLLVLMLNGAPLFVGETWRLASARFPRA